MEITTSWHSYPKIYALGHRAIKELFNEDVIVEEKIDGSQFSFGRFNGELRCKSKGAVINTEVPEKMFGRAVIVAMAMPVRDGWTYRAEYLKVPKHNALAYDRTPKLHLILFDINTGEEQYLSYDEKSAEADRLGLEVVPLLYRGKVENPQDLLDLLQTISILGGQKVEGVVCKNYQRFGLDGKAYMGKYVSEAFKEIHGGEWKAANPTSKDVIELLIMQLKTPARWSKAAQHLREKGQLTDSPRDIGELMKEVKRDVFDECGDMIREALYQHAKNHIQRGIVGGLPEWYKEELMKAQFTK